MTAAINRGLGTTGVLPGKLKLKRRANEFLISKYDLSTISKIFEKLNKKTILILVQNKEPIKVYFDAHKIQAEFYPLELEQFYKIESKENNIILENYILKFPEQLLSKEEAELLHKILLKLESQF